MTLEAFRAFTQVVVGCEYMVRPVCFLILWDVFCRPDRDRADLAAAGLVLLLNAVWWFAEPPLSFRVMLAALVLGYCHVRYGRYYERAAFLLLLYQHIWELSLLLSVCVQEGLDSGLTDRVADPELFYPGMEKIIYLTFSRNRILSGVFFLTILLVLSILVARVIRRPFFPDWQDTVFLSVFNVVGCLFIQMILEITNVKVEQEVFSLFTQRRDWLLKAPLMGLLLYAGELSAIGLWQRLKLLQEERQQQFVQEQQAEAIQKRLREAETFYENIRRVRHEMRNHMANIRGLAASRSYEEMERYMERLDETMKAVGGPYLTGSAVIDVILNDRHRRATGSGISFQAEFSWKETDTIPVFDVGIILSNLLDNALEACERLEGRERYVRLSLLRKEQFLLILVENSFDGQVVREKGSGRLKSSRPAVSAGGTGEHGIGLENVRRIAERYLGGMEIRTEEKVFLVTVMLQQEEHAPVS